MSRSMKPTSVIVLVASQLRFASAQFSNWVAGQVNTSICSWSQPRAALIRDTIYIDGGSIWWTAGLENGTAGPVANQGNYQGIILSYNLNRNFTPNTNVTGILLDGGMSKARGGQGNSNGASPNYSDGAMLANDAEFFLYGGAVFQNNDLYDPPPAYETLEYQAYQYGPDKPLWKPGFNDKRLPDGMTRYIAYGGSANAPSENKAWYFSGLTAPGRGPMYSNTGSKPDMTASVPSDTLITLDMASQVTEKWTNSTLPSTVKGRANPEVVWVPVGSQGILVVLGGVVYPEWTNPGHVSKNETASEKESPEFMSTIDVYDIANDTWYKQDAKGSPGTRTRGCAVVAPAPDHSSFNIYYYGGFDGIHPAQDFYDDVWVLSLPSFTWTRIGNGTARHARAGHKCFLPYPDQMMIVGGYTSMTGTDLTCLEDGPIVLFNITSGQWMDSYSPEKYGPYGIHEKVQAVIGGTATGKATVTAPVPSGWATPALGNVFAKPYDSERMKTYWPYNSSVPTNKTDTPAAGSEPRGVPGWVAPVLGVVLGLVLMTGSILLMCIWRRRLAARAHSDVSSSTDVMSERLYYFVKGHPHHKPSIGVVSSCEDSDIDRTISRNTVSPSAQTSSSPPVTIHEMGDNQITELPDTSSPVELSDTELTPTNTSTTTLPPQRIARVTPLQTNLNSFGSLRSSASLYSVGPSSGSGGTTPATPRYPSRRATKLSTISAVSFSGSEDANGYSLNNIVSPIGPVSPPTEDDDGKSPEDYLSAAGMSPLRNVVSKNDFLHETS